MARGIARGCGWRGPRKAPAPVLSRTGPDRAARKHGWSRCSSSSSTSRTNPSTGRTGRRCSTRAAARYILAVPAHAHEGQEQAFCQRRRMTSTSLGMCAAWPLARSSARVCAPGTRARVRVVAAALCVRALAGVEVAYLGPTGPQRWSLSLRSISTLPSSLRQGSG